MSRYGRINLFAMIGLPLLAMFGSIVVFGVRIDTQMFVLGSNAIPMLIGGLVSGLLIRRLNRRGGGGHGIALAPSLVPAVIGVGWYLYGVVALTNDSGREYFAGPFYLLAAALIVSLIAPIGVLVFGRGGGASS